MHIMMVRRVLLQEAAHYHRPDPCLHNSLHELSNATAQNASTVCQHAYAYMHHRGGSPIPYLLAGLAAMLALIAISLFILACSYWKLVGCVEQHAAARASISTNSLSPAPLPQSLASRPHNSSSYIQEQDPKLLADNTTKLVVIMAGHDKPTFIAQPVGSVALHEGVASSNSFTKV